MTNPPQPPQPPQAPQPPTPAAASQPSQPEGSPQELSQPQEPNQPQEAEQQAPNLGTPVAHPSDKPTEEPAKPTISEATPQPPEPPSTPTPDDTAIVSMLSRLINTQRAHGQKFMLFYTTSIGDAGVHEFDNIDDLVSKIREYEGEDVTLFPVMGWRMRISKPPMRYLLTPFGNLPLFEMPTLDNVSDDDAYMGEATVPMTAPTSSPDERGATPEDEDVIWDSQSYDESETLVAEDETEDEET